jgi:hypothetical protein
MQDGHDARWHENQLEREFAPGEIAETGARVIGAVPVRSGDGIDRYEYAVRLTLVALRSKRDGHPPLDWRPGPRLARVRRVLTQHIDPLGIAASGLYACMGCHYAANMSEGTILLEPTAA